MAEPVISKAEVLRYLGYAGQDYGPELDSLIDEAIAICHSIATPRFTHRVFDLEIMPEGDICIPNTTLSLPGESIREHLAGAAGCALLAATLGSGIETHIRAAQRRDMTAALILDAAATSYIEAVCDKAEAGLRHEAKAQGLYLNFRFSPGYGDLPLEVQPTLLEVLDTGRRIGLTCTENLILLPRKSVTAILGIFPQPPPQPATRGCETCSQRETCKFGKGGITCENRQTDRG